MEQDETRLRIYLAHRTALVDYATPLLGSRAQAEDVVQEAWLRFARDRGMHQPLEQPAAYLFRIVRNLALDWTRLLSAEARRDRAHGIAAGPTPLAASPEDLLLQGEELRRVAAALAELPDRTRAAFEMHRFRGMTFQQIAGQLGVSLPTAQRLAQDALRHIMRRLAARGG